LTLQINISKSCFNIIITPKRTLFRIFAFPNHLIFKELPDKHKKKDMTKVFRISLEGVKPAGGSSTWTRRAREKLAKRVPKHSELKVILNTGYFLYHHPSLNSRGENLNIFSFILQG
jgi:hypothetical protein